LTPHIGETTVVVYPFVSSLVSTALNRPVNECLSKRVK
jgi:hypothetical protein